MSIGTGATPSGAHHGKHHKIVYEGSLSIDSDWGQIEVHYGGARLKLSHHSNVGWVEGNSIHWGTRESYNFQSVEIPFKIELDEAISSLAFSTFHGDDGYRRGDGQGTIRFYINDYPQQFVNNNITGDGLNRSDYDISLANIKPVQD